MTFSQNPQLESAPTSPVSGAPSQGFPTNWNLSPSGIENYLRCPRQYFYANLLQLHTNEISFQSLLGRAVHLIMQDITTRTTEHAGYSRQDFQNSTERLLTPSANILSETRELTEWEQFQKACLLEPRLRQAQLKTQLELAWDSFCDEGGLERLNNDWTVLKQEETLRFKQPFGLTSLNLTGRLDALIKTQTQRLLLLDYKTTRSLYNTSKAQAHFEAAVLDPQAKTPHVQLPLYRLMLQSQPEYHGQPIDIGLQLIRPKRYGGSPLLIIRDEQLTSAETTNRLALLLKNHIDVPLNSAQPFEALGDSNTCQRCDYKQICERGQRMNTDFADSSDDEES